MNKFNLELAKTIKTLREKMGISQELFSKQIGVSREVVSNIENGKRKITAEELKVISKILNIPAQYLLDPSRDIDIRIINEKKQDKATPSGLRINVPQKNTNKFKEVLLYILNKIGSRPNVGETVIYKILYFIDFDYYEKYEEQLIGATYQKNNYGPTPKEFIEIVKQMEGKDLVKIRDRYFTYPQTKYLPLREPDLAGLSAREINMIDQVLAKLSNMNAQKISEYSHNDVPWLTTEDGDIIEYESVFYRTALYSVREFTGSEDI
ncbi:MAG: DUF4065 domain-containing protein [Candidatus Cloacimonetes bacterium]|nr:DUF4065 domain-containing protein [Candidatus Cloacimonadota bacterium]